jgi:hypothetical protein
MSETTLPRLAGDDGGDRRDWREWEDQVSAAEDQPGHGRMFVMRPVGRAGVAGAAAGVAPNAFRELVMPVLAPPRIARIAIDGVYPN